MSEDKDKAIAKGEDKELRNYVIKKYITEKKTYEEMCALLGIGMDSFHKLLKRFDIPARKVGRRYKK